MRYKSGAIIAAFAVLAVTAIAGWVRKPQPAPAYAVASYPASAPTPAVNPASEPLPPSQTAYRDSYGAPVAQSTQYQQDAPPCVSMPAAATTASYHEPVVYESDRYSRSLRRPVVVRHQYVASAPASAPVYYTERRHGRSVKKSVAIVAGGSGVGAAIGALAGGGKGAGIGALAGGGAGFLYDRLTHNR